jgi:hypothetical protein
MRQKVRFSTLGLHKVALIFFGCDFTFSLSQSGVCSASAAFGCVAAVPPQKGKKKNEVYSSQRDLRENTVVRYKKNLSFRKECVSALVLLGYFSGKHILKQTHSTTEKGERTQMASKAKNESFL